MVLPCSLAAAVLSPGANRIVSLAPSDLLIIGLYFAMVLGIGIYLRRYANTSNDFFMAGREMTAWVAGLSFLSANLGAIELMGWAASDLSVRNSGHTFLLDRRLPVDGFSRAGDDAVLLHLQNAFRTRLSAAALRRVDARLERHLFRRHDRPDVGHQYVCHGAGDEGRAGMEHSLQHLGFLAHRRCLRRSGRSVFGHLQ